MSSEHETIVYRLARILIKLNHGQRVEPKALADEFGVNLRTIQRDLNQRFAYLPLLKEGGRYFLDDYALGKLTTKDIGRFASLAGVQGLFPSLNDEFLREIFDDHTSAALLVRGHNYEDLRSRLGDFRVIEAAITDRRRIKFNYQSERERTTRRLADPYRLLNDKGIWYLAAVNDGKLKTFAFSRLADPVVTDENFTFSADINDRLNQDESIWLSEISTKIVLKIAPAVAAYFRRRKLIANQVIEKELEDGGLLLSATVGHENQVLPIVRYWMPHISIVSPDGLQRRLNETLVQYLHGGS
jgi:predicted DNA-binding transcriptional regulator YafY